MQETKFTEAPEQPTDCPTKYVEHAGVQLPLSSQFCAFMSMHLPVCPSNVHDRDATRVLKENRTSVVKGLVRSNPNMAEKFKLSH